ncbi:uncharacterized protein LOC111912785 [Lactuca sativa]|uniref:uncharacterized protein LOC111912785 n=1 Tax=Lactuca sativa TaxID=4236 RepID=UPI000CD94EFF|nr:uncharacterized protein LOC111912785 [Lactuca sativa]
MKDQQALLRNQQASILNIEKQLGQLAQQVNERRPGALPSNTKSNLKGAHISIVTTRSGKITTPLAPIQQEDPKLVQEEEEEHEKSQIPDPTRRVDVTDSMSPPPEQKSLPPVKPYQPPLPFPARARQEKNEVDYQKFLEHIKALQINISFIEAVAQMPIYANFLKELLANRRKME